MSFIFISYRRSDSENVTGRIYDHLTRHFGRENVFKDVDSIPAGVDFQARLEKDLKKCRVFIAVIGKEWLTVTAKDGTRRLDDPDDWVRLEILAAFKKKNIRIIPLLVKGVEMPKPEELPIGLKKLAKRHAARARPDPDFRKDMEWLIQQIESAQPKKSRKPVSKFRKASSKKKTDSSRKKKPKPSKPTTGGASIYGYKTVKFNKSGISELPTDKPVIYKILTQSKTTNYIGAAKKGAVQATIAKHLTEGRHYVPGVTVQIKRLASIREAEKRASQFVEKNSPKYN